MLKFFSNLFDENAKALQRYGQVVEDINRLQPEIQDLSNDQLAAQTDKLKKEIKRLIDNEGQTEAQALETVLPEAFATVRETSRRVIGLHPYDVQLLAGVALHYRNVTEQKTGEGKTLTVAAPIYLNALLGKGVHLVTVNDYLAEVGVGWMGPIYHFLGLSAAVIVHDQAKLYNPDIDSEERGDERLEHFERISRQQAYAADITYGTNNEFGFDYLRDNMVQDINQMVQRQDHPHHFAIIDEADSILIDEARTPLIISAPDTESVEQYYQYAQMVESLTREVDFKIDEKARSVVLTDLGVKRLEQKLGVSNLYEESFDTIHHVEAALKAKTLYHRDKEYIVRDNQVVIVDEHTGRLMHGRRYSDGLHQAIEAKEGATIQRESRTLATISIQNYFRLYGKLAGMTGTAVTESEEFNKIYTMNVLEIPTHRPVIRDDLSDVVYKTTAAKYSAIVRRVEEIHDQGRPILIGTRSIEHNQTIAKFLHRKNIKHQVLNAKNNEKEAFIIADAGRKNAITVATNIAGRGVDIVLGGAKPEIKDYRKKNLTDKRPAKSSQAAKLAAELNLPPSFNPANYKLKSYQQALEKWQRAHDEVVEVGGLFILGTERHEARRIDNQLRGRSGRQGDPGTSQFYLALEDEIMRIFGGEQISKVMDFMKVDENQPIEHNMVSKSIESAQVKVEGFFFDQRKRLVEFDDVMNKHREVIYRRRRRLLEQGSDNGNSANDREQDDGQIKTVDVTPTDQRGQTARPSRAKSALRDQILDYILSEAEAIVGMRAPDSFTSDEYDAIVKDFTQIIPFDVTSQRELAKNLGQITDSDELVDKLMEIVERTYQSREKAFGADRLRQLERLVVLSTIDEKWMDHLDAMDNLRQGIWLRGDKNTVLSEYKKEAFGMFEALIANIESTIARRMFRVQPVAQPRPIIDESQLRQQKEDIHEPLAKEVADATPPGADQAPRQTQGELADMAAALKTAKGGKRATPGQAKVKIGRNDPCPCGSGLKYKKCGLIGAPEHRG